MYAGVFLESLSMSDLITQFRESLESLDRIRAEAIFTDAL
jgi:hypothetical protein